jgi:hypothetical protein
MLYFPRMCIRTLGRLLGLCPPCAPGCEETFSQVFFSKESMIYYAFVRHNHVRKRESVKFAPDVTKEEGFCRVSSTSGVRVGRRRHIRGWGSEYQAFMEEVKELVLEAGI